MGLFCLGFQDDFRIMAMLQDVEDEFPIKGNIQALAFQMAGDVVFNRTVVRMLAHEF